jgi:hypothetical protein
MRNIQADDVGFYMSIVVTKISEALYVAKATPPHVLEELSTHEPMRMHKMLEELIARGAHPTDAGDALNLAEREWLNKSAQNRD